jgi:hypothetical protein
MNKTPFKWSIFVGAFGHVENDHSMSHGDLNGREADAGRGIHGLEHIVHKRADALVDFGHRRGHKAQTRIGEGDYGP